MPAEATDVIFKVLEGGKEVASSNVIPFPVDAVGGSAISSLAGEGISTGVSLGNGTAATVSQLTVAGSTSATATTTGVGILSMEVGAAGVAIAPALGILAGVGLYNLAPDFWTSVSNKLMEAGQTVGGKVRAFLNGENKQTGFSKETIEIYKQAFIEAGLFNGIPSVDYDYGVNPYCYIQAIYTTNYKPECTMFTSVLKNPLLTNRPYFYITDDRWSIPINTMLPLMVSISYTNDKNYTEFITDIPTFIFKAATDDSIFDITFVIKISKLDRRDIPFSPVRISYALHFAGYSPIAYNLQSSTDAEIVYCLDEDGTYRACLIRNTYLPCNSISAMYNNAKSLYELSNHQFYELSDIREGSYNAYVAYGLQWLKVYKVINDNVQPDAILPTDAPISETYPHWTAWEIPENLPTVYPVELPQIAPYANQEQAQNPTTDPDPDILLNTLIDTLPVPSPITGEQSVAPIDPDVQPEPDPLPDPVPLPDPLPDPVDPNIQPTPSPSTIPAPLPSTILSNKLFTVYAPTIYELNALGSYLWSTDTIASLLKMWQNPLDGVISLQKVYGIPDIGEKNDIILGYLNSGVKSSIVMSQFQTIECGSIEIKEVKGNATDYSPYVDLHLYLPFIGFVELDPDEFMNGYMTITYKIDFYTGTYLAEIRCTRVPDLADGVLLYQFSGNASQQIPITAGQANGLLSTLVSIVGIGGAVVSGGALGIAGASLSLGHTLTHEMLHVGHSGSLIANSGIMGSRKPLLIIGRRHSYDANFYNELYGYPSNKTIYLRNTKGFVRIKAGRIISKATQDEKEEIMSYLKKGVIV